jgi:hypothetical protein
VGGIRVALLAGDGGDVDDATVAPGQQARDDRLAAQEDAGQVDVDDLTHSSTVSSQARLVGPGDAGVVDQDVEAPERRLRLFRGGLDVGQAGHIDGDRVRRPLERAGRLAQGRFHPCPQADAGARGQQAFGDGQADAAGGAGDDGGLAGQSIDSSALLRCRSGNTS